MKNLLYILIIFISSNVAYTQVDIGSLTNLIDTKVESSDYQISYLSDSLQQQTCESLIYFNTKGLHKLKMGCGDASIEMNREHYYFKNNELVYVIAKRYYFNAPQAFTEEVAKKDGVLSGWFDPRKTRVEQYEYFFENGRMIKMIDNDGKEIPSNDDSFKKTETVIFGYAYQGKTLYNTLSSKYQRKEGKYKSISCKEEEVITEPEEEWEMGGELNTKTCKWGNYYIVTNTTYNEDECKLGCSEQNVYKSTINTENKIDLFDIFWYNQYNDAHTFFMEKFFEKYTELKAEDEGCFEESEFVFDIDLFYFKDADKDGLTFGMNNGVLERCTGIYGETTIKISFEEILPFLIQLDSE